jgi:branched-chain amino acid transport system ATP-binding protein
MSERVFEQANQRDGTVVSVRGLHAGYHGRAVVKDLSLEVRAGEVVALLGANGAGKTTTLLTLSGLLPPIAGEMELLGGPVPSRREAHRLVHRGVAHVPEDRGLFPGLSVDKHLRLARPPKGESYTWVYDELPALRRISDRRAGLLSGGEQQMLALARALVGRPKVLLIDEMSLGLAPIIVQQLTPLVRHVADELGCGVLLVEQHVDLALTITDRAYVMSHGQLVLEETGEVLRRNPTLLEKAYLGELGDREDEPGAASIVAATATP